jgi:DNA-binding PadR family transcriptional regulator
MTKARANLTELEGAILSIVRAALQATPYRIRQVFLASPSAEWSGSAGAVYPAVKRLEAHALIKPTPPIDERGTRAYRLTRAGETAHESWLCDVERAASPGLDPFRTRAGFWHVLPAAKRRTLLQQLRREILAARARLAKPDGPRNEGDKIMDDLHLGLQDLRLQWIDKYLKALKPKLR